MKNVKLEQLLKAKKENLVSYEDYEKYDVIVNLLKEEDCFFKMPAATAMGILEFLNLSYEDAKLLYLELISPKEFMEKTPKINISVFK